MKFIEVSTEIENIIFSKNVFEKGALDILLFVLFSFNKLSDDDLKIFLLYMKLEVHFQFC